MKALALVTHTADCENKWRSFQCLGNDVVVEQYDNRPHARHGELVEAAVREKPDLIIYVGAIEKYHGKPVPSIDILKRLRDVAPMVHICGDASDQPWWDWLDRYENEGCFSVQVSIDGNGTTPVAAYGFVLLTPLDASVFEPKPWDQRTVLCSVAGGRGHTRRATLIGDLMEAGCLTLLNTGGAYGAMARAMCDSKFTFNVPINGTGDGLHVKGRVVEAGFARSCLLEMRSSPSANWFTPGVDYVEYESSAEAVHHVERAKDDPAPYLETARSLYERCIREHHPAVFWRKVLDRCGIATALWHQQSSAA